MDLGAYTGDTLELFSGLCEEPFRAVAVEPEARNFRKLLESAERLFPQSCSVFGREAESSKALCTLVNAAAGDECRTIEFTHGAGRGGAGGKGKTRPALQLTADHILKELGMLQGQGSAGAPAPKAPLQLIIKMDLEGAEAAAIRGAENTIKTLKPRMLVSAYHRTEDLFALPRLVLGMRADYRLFLRRDPCIPAWGVNYFFI